MTSHPSAILTYHSLDESGSVISIRPQIFRSHMESLAESGIPIVPLDQVADRPGTVAITFDDGFENLARHAFPVLGKLRIPATVFVVSQYAGLRSDWPTQPSGRVPLQPLLGWNELRSLPPGVTVGAHTATHPHLAALPARECEREMRECSRTIADQLGYEPLSLAYPYGSVSRPVVATASRYFRLAVGTRFEFVAPNHGRFDLPRLDMFYFRDRKALSGLFGVASRLYVGLRNAARLARARVAA